MDRIKREDFLWAEVAKEIRQKPARKGSRRHEKEAASALTTLSQDLAKVRLEIDGPEPPQLTQVAKTMVLCGLPYRQTAERTIVRRAQQADGRVTVTFQAHLDGVVMPYGSDRNFFHWATDRSIKSATPFVPWDDAGQFLSDMKQTDSGANYVRLRETYRRLSGLSVTVERQTADRENARIMPIFDISSLPRTLSASGEALIGDNSPRGIQFSASFFNEIMQFHVPFPWPILRTLARKPQMQDYVMFLHWRTFAARTETLITWDQLRQQLWQEDTNTSRIRQRFEDAIRALRIVYPGLPAATSSSGLCIGPAVEGKTLIRGAMRRIEDRTNR